MQNCDCNLCCKSFKKVNFTENIKLEYCSCYLCDKKYENVHCNVNNNYEAPIVHDACSVNDCNCIQCKQFELKTKLSNYTYNNSIIFDDNETKFQNCSKAGIQVQKVEIWDNVVGPFNVDDIISLSDRVYDSGVPNYIGCRIPVPSKLNIPYLENVLPNYSDRQIIEFLKFGWPINYTSHDLPHSKVLNHKGAVEFEDLIDKYVANEIKSGATLGPFTNNPLLGELVTSPLNSVPKKDDTDRRVILDLSYPRGHSVNDGIPKGEYQGEEIELSYPGVDDLAKQIKLLGPGCVLYKKDLKKAYRQIPIDPGDIHFLGYSWKNKFFIDRNAPMGLRTSALMCQRMTGAIVHIHKQFGFNCVNYVDDLAGAAQADLAEKAYNNLGKIISDIGLVESIEKACTPSTKMVFLGVEFCTIKMECRITDARLAEIKQLILSWLGKKFATKVELQSLIGSLQFVAKCVRPGRVFIGRMLHVLGKLKNQHHKFDLKSEFRKDLCWWKQFLDVYNGVSLIPDVMWSKPDKIFATDACLQGCGGFCENEYFHAIYPTFIKSKKLCINSLEMLTVTVALKLWAHKLSGKKALIYCDNEVTVQAINSGKVKDSFLLKNLREQRYLCALNDCEIKAVHLPGSQNRLADALSRWTLSSVYVNKFKELTKYKNMKNIIVKDILFKFNDNY